MSRVTRAVVVLLVVVAGTVLSGCGKQARLTQDELFERVIAAETKAGSSHLAMTLQTGPENKVESKGQMRLGKAPTDTAVAMTGVDQQLGVIETRLVDQKYYFRIGAFTGDKFIRLDLRDTDNPVVRVAAPFMANIDPGRQIARLRPGLTGFDNTGKTVELDGVEAVPYVLTFDSADSEPVTYVIYVGPEDLPRRLTSGLPGAAPRSGTVRVDYTNWGDKVVIKAPAPSKIQKNGPLARLGAKLAG